MDQPIQKRPRRHHHRPRLHHPPIPQPHPACTRCSFACHSASEAEESVFTLASNPAPRTSTSSTTRSTTSACLINSPFCPSSTSRIFTRYSALSHCALGRPHRRPPARIQQPELDPARIRHLAHHAAQRVHLAHQVSLGDPANRRVAAHLRNQIQVQRKQSRPQPHARRRHRRLAPRVPGPHHHHIELFRKRHSLYSTCEYRRFRRSSRPSTAVAHSQPSQGMPSSRRKAGRLFRPAK